MFGIGYVRPLSATWGSLATGIVLYFIWPWLILASKLIITTATFILGCYLSNKIVREKGTDHDPYYIVMDESVGMMITTIFLTQIPWHWLLAFILFRIFDIAKLWPASYYDKQRM